jgi:hypothetical protein
MFYTRNLGFHMNQHAILDSNLPICERVQDLLSRPILDEKVAMMIRSAQGVPRLGRHIRNKELLTSGVGAWQDESNDQAVTLQLRFPTADAPIKLRLISPDIFFTKNKPINFSSC